MELLHFLRGFYLRVFIGRSDVDLAVDASLDASHDLVDGDVLLNGHTHAVVDGCAVRVEQEIFRIHRHELDCYARLLNHTNGCLALHAWDRLRGRDVFHLGANDDLTNACSVNLSQELDLVDRLFDLVFLEVFGELRAQRFDVDRLLIGVLQVVFNIKKLARAEDRFHDLRVASFDGLLGRRGDNFRSF